MNFFFAPSVELFLHITFFKARAWSSGLDKAVRSLRVLLHITRVWLEERLRIRCCLRASVSIQERYWSIKNTIYICAAWIVRLSCWYSCWASQCGYRHVLVSTFQTCIWLKVEHLFLYRSESWRRSSDSKRSDKQYVWSYWTKRSNTSSVWNLPVKRDHSASSVHYLYRFLVMLMKIITRLTEMSPNHGETS